MAVASITSTYCAVLKYLEFLTAIIICQRHKLIGDIIAVIIKNVVV